jgi:hypothetical protein
MLTYNDGYRAGYSGHGMIAGAHNYDLPEYKQGYRDGLNDFFQRKPNKLLKTAEG